MLLLSHKHRALVLPFRQDIASLLPHAVQIDYQGQPHLAFHHGVEETKLLRNLDISAPAPIVEHYDWPGPKRPFDVQVKTAAMLTMHDRAFVLNEMGTGKTNSALWAYDFLRKARLVKKMLVVAPLSTLNFVWRRAIMETLPNTKAVVLHGDRAKRLKLLKMDVDIYIVNHDGLNVIHKELARRPDIDIICIDEVGAYRNASAVRSKVAREVCMTRRRVWGLTGSPTPNAPTDAYGISKLVTPGRAPKSFTQFRNDTMIQVSAFRWVPRKEATEVVAELLQPSVRFSLDDTVELPQMIPRPLDVEQGPRQRAVYKQMADQMAVLLHEGQVTAANGGVMLSKLLQVSGGYIYMDDGRYAVLDNDLRLQAMTEIIDQSWGKVIVFAPFIHTVHGIELHLKKEGLDYRRVTGGTPTSERDEIFTTFQNTDQIDVLVAHPGCMSHGLTLTAADTIVWFGPITSLETFEQANARITRIGQKRKQQVFMLQGTEAERRIYRRLQSKKEVQDGILDILKNLHKDEQ